VIPLLELLSRQKRALIAVLLAVAALGALAGVRMPAAILPEVTFPRIAVIADSGEQPAEEVVRTITRPLEDALKRIPELRETRSVTSRGAVEIHLDCDWRASMPHVLQLAQAQIDGVRPNLPAGTTVEARLMSPVQFPVLGLSLMSRGRSPAELRDLAVQVLAPELSRVPGVSEVVVQGGERPEARVLLDPIALEARHLDVAAVADAVARSGRLESVGLHPANGELYLGLVDARPHDLEALRMVPVPVDSAAPVALGSLAEVTLAAAPEFTRYAAGGGPAVLINVMRKPSGSTVQLSDTVHAWFKDHPRALPPDVRLETFYDQADLVRASVDSVRDSLLVGALMALAVVLLFLRSGRLGLAAAVVLPGAIMLTICGLAATGQSFNLMTLGGIAAAVGLVLDDAIVVVEHLAHRARVDATAADARRAVAEITPTLIGSSACTLAIFLPFLYLGGVTGAFFRVLALAMVLMLTSSLVLCIVLVPWFPVPRPRVAPAAEPAPGLLERALDPLLRRRWIAFAIAALFIAAVVPLRATLGSGFLPEMDEGSLILDYVAPPGFTLAETDRILRQVEREIAAVPEIASWSRRTGDQLGFFITEPNIGDYVLRLKTGRKRSADEIADALRERIAATQPALEIEFGQLIEDVIGDLTTSPEPIEVRILGEDRRLDQARAEQVARILETVRGVVDVKSGVVVSGPNLTVKPGPGALRAGLDAGALAERVAPYVSGVEAGQIARGVRAWPIRLLLPRPPATAGPTALADVRVPVADGAWGRLGDLATIAIEPGETEINRDNQRTMVASTARLAGRDLGSAMAEIQRRIVREIPLAPGMAVHYGGLWAEQQQSFRGLLAVLVGAAGAVLLVFLASFRSWGRAAAVLVVCAASLAGVFAVLHVGGATFNIASFVGAIMVVGIVAENAYFLVAAYRDALVRGETPDIAASFAARRRLRPVLMTTAAGIAALAPLALGWGSGSALLRPLALAVIGGFMNSALLLLLVLPPLLAATGAGRE
jgi:multidrug efflux pump subunit AcrB